MSRPLPRLALLPFALAACFWIAPIPTASADDPAGTITFAVNVHDWVDPERSAETILRLVGMFEKHGVRGDFYFTDAVTRAYAEKRPDVIDRIKKSDMTVSYHIRPPHPLYPGFDRALRGLSDADLARTLKDAETYRLDLSTARLDREHSGGYSYVREVFGRDPVVASVQNGDPRLRSAALKVLGSMGARVTIAYHEQGTDLDRPFEYLEGLLIRPSDFSITRWSAGEMRKENFWWNMLDSRMGAEFDPAARLRRSVEEWQGTRKPFITALIHENNFYSRGAESWTAIYWTGEDKSRPAKPPYDLETRGSARPRTAAEQERIWAAYEAMVAWSARHLIVATSADLVKLAAAERK